MNDRQLYETFQNYFAKELLRNWSLKCYLNIQNNKQKKQLMRGVGREFYRKGWELF